MGYSYRHRLNPNKVAKRLSDNNFQWWSALPSIKCTGTVLSHEVTYTFVAIRIQVKAFLWHVFVWNLLDSSSRRQTATTLHYYHLTGIFDLVPAYPCSILNHCSGIVRLEGNKIMSTSNMFKSIHWIQYLMFATKAHSAGMRDLLQWRVPI